MNKVKFSLYDKLHPSKRGMKPKGCQCTHEAGSFNVDTGDWCDKDCKPCHSEQPEQAIDKKNLSNDLDDNHRLEQVQTWEEDRETERLITGQNEDTIYKICPTHKVGVPMPLEYECEDCTLYLSGRDIRQIIRKEKEKSYAEGWYNGYQSGEDDVEFMEEKLTEKGR